MDRLWWYILTPFVAFSALAVYVASVRFLRRGTLLSELPTGSAEVPVRRMGSDCAVGWQTPQIAILFDRD
jgi:hypothetical protein